ncbi:pentapeptide repeat-containing protein [[Clostridium] symbiosum]|uniref:pentapeptide repeat-containing protein n=1 Tax=Clostridium symbiosum TaxID=1512 RepID=UPI001922144E|nr:pentapeptide repeat-containing protein [[Clostridium] symbiosum]MDB2032483.1 pentapeptide repeat-containing protein [[Clostridium] symbiosum]
MEKKEIEAPQIVHGYKVFKHDWTCRGKQYTCPGRFIEEGKLEVCGRGMHFCQTAADCFNYYSFDSRNKVAEVIAYGEVVTDGDKSCTDKLEIVREIPWEEVLRIVNTGKNCTGKCNTGNCNTGDCNTGDRNTGDCNTGDWNTGDRNTGDWNTGDWNTGNWNTGDWNTGDWNTGNWNTGDRNTGDRNTGDWNKSSFNNGCFMTEEPKIMLFNKQSELTYRQWMDSSARYLLNQIPKNVIEWVYSSDMTDEEKAANPTFETTGGYLKVLDESECGQLWWNDLTDDKKAVIKSLPNFDAEIFEQCTGIKIN